jgi:hypothetical protein
VKIDRVDDESDRLPPDEIRLEVALILAGEWRNVRRRASRIVAVFVPCLLGLIAASFPLITRRELSSTWLVLADAALGGLLGSVFVCVARLAGVAHDRHPRDEQAYYAYDELLVLVVLPLIVSGVAAGVVAASLLVSLASRDAYSPQTVYVLAVALSVVISGSMRPLIVGVPHGTRVRT